MRRLAAIILVAFAGVHAASSSASAQSAKDLIGTWTLVSVTLDEGGTKSFPFGTSPKGIAYFDGARQSIVILNSEMPKFASNNRMTGTAEENKASVQGSLTFFGPYTFDEASKSMTVKVDGSNYPNWTGLDLKRTVNLSGDTMTVTNPTPSASGAGGVATIVWKRAQ